ncbi:hypothetical protein FPCIR_14412, partial [Fusarium pseudocircinatum]
PPPPRLLWSSWSCPSANSFAEYSASEQRTVTGLGVLPFWSRDAQTTSYGSPPYEAPGEQFMPRRGAPAVSPRHDTSPDVDSSYRTSQKYTIEQGDFIIYARHDRKLNWSSVVREFANQFGNTPQRTIQGLQAWHYRINNQIPVWDEDGWLCFDHDDDEKPRQISIKARERHMYLHPGESLGIASRYPERAIHYTWVDPMTKLVAKDWACPKYRVMANGERLMVNGLWYERIGVDGFALHLRINNLRKANASNLYIDYDNGIQFA